MNPIQPKIRSTNSFNQPLNSSLKRRKDETNINTSEQLSQPLNFGEEMLKSLGWSEGKGVGKYEQGIQTPIELKPKNERIGIQDNENERERSMEIKLSHYGEETTNEHIETQIEIESIRKRLDEMMKEENEYQKRKKQSIEMNIETLKYQLDHQNQQMKEKQNIDKWLSNGIELIQSIENELESIVEMEIEECKDFIERIEDWKRELTLQYSIELNDDICKIEMFEWLIQMIIDKQISGMVILKNCWNQEKEKKGFYYELFDELLKECEDKTIQSFIQHNCDVVSLEYFEEYLSQLKTNKKNSYSNVIQKGIDYYNENYQIVSNEYQEHMKMKIKQLFFDENEFDSISLEVFIEYFKLHQSKDTEDSSEVMNLFNQKIFDLLDNQQDEMIKTLLHKETLEMNCKNIILTSIMISIKQYVNDLQFGDVIDLIKQFEDDIESIDQQAIISDCIDKMKSSNTFTSSNYNNFIDCIKSSQLKNDILPKENV